MDKGTLRHGGGLLGGSVFNQLTCELHSHKNSIRFVSAVEKAVKSQQIHAYFGTAAKYYTWNFLTVDRLKLEMARVKRITDRREAIIMMYGYYLGEVDYLFKTRFFKEKSAHLPLDSAVKYAAHLETSPFFLTLEHSLPDYDHIWYEISPDYEPPSAYNPNWAYGKVQVGDVKGGLVYRRSRGWESVSLTVESAPPSTYGRWIDYLLEKYGEGRNVISSISLPILGSGRVSIHRIMWPISSHTPRISDESSPELMYAYTLLLPHRSLYVEIDRYGLNPRRDPQLVISAVKGYLASFVH